MPHGLNIVAGILCVLVALFLGIKLSTYLNLLAAPFKDAVASGIDLGQVKQFYALGRATSLFIGIGLIFFLGQWPPIVTYIFGLFLLRGLIELSLAAKGRGVYVSSMLVFYEDMYKKNLEIAGEEFTFRHMVNRCRELMEKEPHALEESGGDTLQKPTVWMMRIYAATSANENTVRQRAIRGKLSACIWSAILFVIAAYFCGFRNA